MNLVIPRTIPQLDLIGSSGGSEFGQVADVGHPTKSRVPAESGADVAGRSATPSFDRLLALLLGTPWALVEAPVQSPVTMAIPNPTTTVRPQTPNESSGSPPVRQMGSHIGASPSSRDTVETPLLQTNGEAADRDFAAGMNLHGAGPVSRDVAICDTNHHELFAGVPLDRPSQTREVPSAKKPGPESQPADASQIVVNPSERGGSLDLPSLSVGTRRDVAEQAAFVNQLSASLAQRIDPRSDDGQFDFRMRLDLPELGTVHVRVLMVADVVSVRFVASDESARRAIESQLTDLRQSLRPFGLSVGRCDVLCDDGRHGSRRHHAEMPVPPLRSRDSSGRGGHWPQKTRGARQTTGQLDYLA